MLQSCSAPPARFTLRTVKGIVCPCTHANIAFFFCKYRQVVVSFAVNTAFIQWICLCELPTECAGNTVPSVTPLPWDTIAFWQKHPEGGEQSQRCRGVASSPGKG